MQHHLENRLRENEIIKLKIPIFQKYGAPLDGLESEQIHPEDNQVFVHTMPNTEHS